jgi:hypothetical protein
MRLTKQGYFAVQPIYYPGFTIAGGIGEAGGTISTTILLAATPPGSADFWLTLVALIGLVGMQAVYWLFTHPVNKLWLQGEKLGSFSSGFFSFASAGKPDRQVEWTDLRDHWEYSHVARAGISFVSFIALIIAIP